MKTYGVVLAAAAAMVALPVAAEELGQTAARFGARQSLTDISISPSGDRILYIAPGVAADETIYTVDLNSSAEPVSLITMNQANARLQWCDWATDSRIICEVYGIQEVGGTLIYFTRMLGISAEEGKVIRLSPDSTYKTLGLLQDGGSVLALDIDGEEERILMTRDYIKNSGPGTRLFEDREGLGVDLFDITNGRTRTVEEPNARAQGYIADENGRVRIMMVADSTAGGYDGNDYRYLYRDAASDDWKPLSAVDAGGSIAEGFWPVAVDSKSNLAYGFDSHNGYRALYTVALDGTNRANLLMSRDDVDVDSLIRIGRKRRVVGASYATEKRQVKYFDPELERLASALGKALPGTPLISIKDASEDENSLVLIASSDTDPGVAYLYKKDSRQLSELLPLRDPLVDFEMGQMQPVNFPAADGTSIPGYLTLPPGSDGRNLPAIVLPHGGPGARDEWGFDWLVQFLVARGYAVMQPNFRGSAGYGEAWFGKNGFQAWQTAISDVNDAGRWLVSQGIADGDRMGVMGWSYGGYAALQSQVLDPSLYKAVVAIAPVTDLELLREESRRYTNFRATDRFIGTGPHVAAGSPARHADRFAAPVLLVHGTVDLNTGVAQSKLMKSRLEGSGKAVDYLEFGGLDHYLEHGRARGIMLNRIGQFLEASLKE